MAGIDESLTFHPLRIAVLTVSDTRSEETDRSGALLAERLTAAGHMLAGKMIVTSYADRHGVVEEHLKEELGHGWTIKAIHGFGGNSESLSVRGWLAVVLEK